MKQTTNYSLNKIELADSPPDITVLNPNFDKIDTEMKRLTDKDTSVDATIEQIKKDYLPKTGGDITNNLTVKSKYVARSVNGEVADANGNITIDVGGDVQSVNGVQPDENGNVELDLGGDVASVDGVTPDDNGDVKLNASTRDEILEATERVTDVEVDPSVAEIQSLQQAVARVEATLVEYLKLTGGTMTGAIKTDGDAFINKSNASWTSVFGGSNIDGGASIELNGHSRDHVNKGCFDLRAKSADGTTSTLIGFPDGTLKWSGKNVSAMGFPSGKRTQLTVGATGSQFTAPDDGWFYAHCSATLGTKYATLQTPSMAVTLFPVSGVSNANGIVPIKKGEVLTVFYTSDTIGLYFIYAEGRNF